MFPCTPSRGGRCRRAAVDIFHGVFFQCLVGFRFFIFRFLYFERTRPTASTRQTCLMHLSTSNEARTREQSDRGRFLHSGKKALHTGVRTECHFLISLSVCLCVCVIFVVFSDCESCTRPISPNPGSMEAGEHGQTRGTWFFARRLEVVAVAGLMWVSWCASVGRDFFVLSMSLNFQIRRPRAVSVKSVNGLRQPTNLPIENSRPPILTSCTVESTRT